MRIARNVLALLPMSALFVSLRLRCCNMEQLHVSIAVLMANIQIRQRHANCVMQIVQHV
jgi:hypothetical protein